MKDMKDEVINILSERNRQLEIQNAYLIANINRLSEENGVLAKELYSEKNVEAEKAE